MAETPERRKSVRVETNRPALYSGRRGAPDGLLRQGSVVNMSTDGFLIETSHPERDGAELEIEIPAGHTLTSGQPLFIAGKVVRVAELGRGLYGLGVRLLRKSMKRQPVKGKGPLRVRALPDARPASAQPVQDRSRRPSPWRYVPFALLLLCLLLAWLLLWAETLSERVPLAEGAVVARGVRPARAGVPGVFAALVAGGGTGVNGTYGTNGTHGTDGTYGTDGTHGTDAAGREPSASEEEDETGVPGREPGPPRDRPGLGEGSATEGAYGTHGTDGTDGTDGAGRGPSPPEEEDGTGVPGREPGAPRDRPGLGEGSATEGAYGAYGTHGTDAAGRKPSPPEEEDETGVPGREPKASEEEDGVPGRGPGARGDASGLRGRSGTDRTYQSYQSYGSHPSHRPQETAPAPAHPEEETPRPSHLADIPVFLEVDKSAFQLTVFVRGKPVRRLPVGLGHGGSTPEGRFVIGAKLTDPDWYRAGDVVPAGDPRNEIGRRWMGLTGKGGPTPYGMHPASDPESVGRPSSRGCIRLRPEDAETLFRLCPSGTPVSIHQ